MIIDVRSRDDYQLRLKDCKKIKRGQQWSFLILDAAKWPMKLPEQAVIIPRQLKDVFEEFTQMYERNKRGTTNRNATHDKEKGGSGKASKQKEAGKNNQNPTAIIMNWYFLQGDCELQTYTLSDQKREPFLLKLSCMQGLILL